MTRDKAHLEAGAKAADYLSFSQASWDPHFIYTANPFGACTADNVDTATWLDARQCELVEPFIFYGLELGRQDLVERGIAAARAGTVLIHHTRHIENNIYPHVNLYGFRLGPENINHEGHNQSAMRTHPSWGECSGIFTGLADAARFTGGGIIDLDHGFAVGTFSCESLAGGFPTLHAAGCGWVITAAHGDAKQAARFHHEPGASARCREGSKIKKQKV